MHARLVACRGGSAIVCDAICFLLSSEVTFLFSISHSYRYNIVPCFALPWLFSSLFVLLSLCAPLPLLLMFSLLLLAFVVAVAVVAFVAAVGVVVLVLLSCRFFCRCCC